MQTILARGFFVWGRRAAKPLGAGFLLFDYVCSNRFVWGADRVHRIPTPRYRSVAPDRWLEKATRFFPPRRRILKGSAEPVLQAIEDAGSKRIETDSTSSRQNASANPGPGFEGRPPKRKRPADRDPAARHRRRHRACPLVAEERTVGSSPNSAPGGLAVVCSLTATQPLLTESAGSKRRTSAPRN